MQQLNLPLECKNEDHNWSYWRSNGPYSHISTCNICGVERLLVPRNSEESSFVKVVSKMVKDYCEEIYKSWG